MNLFDTLTWAENEFASELRKVSLFTDGTWVLYGSSLSTVNSMLNMLDV